MTKCTILAWLCCFSFLGLQAQEKSLTLADLLRADAIRMGNGVQGGAQVTRLRDAEGRVLAEWQA